MNHFDERELQMHVSILGWLYIVANAFFLLLAALALGLLPTLGAISGDKDAALILSIFGTAFSLLMALLGLPGLLAGYGLLKRKSWARTLTIVLGILGLVNFPIGTAIGVYTLLVLLQQSANEYFTTQRPA
jgi:hypothetical protein